MASEAVSADIADETLVRSALAGDEGAFETLVHRYEDHVSRIMWRFSRDQGTHSDLVHEVFVQVYLGMERFRGDAPFVHWLSALASRTGLRWWRKQGQGPKWCQLPDDMEDTRRPQEEISVANRRQAAAGLREMLSELGAEDRTALTLMYYEKKNAREIAELLGWTHTATRMRISRARRKLQQIARRHGLEWEEQ